MDGLLHEAVRARAHHRCEYCHFPAEFAELPFHIDHIVARQHGGRSVSENLAWACCHCNRFKGPNLSGIDPMTAMTADLFHPRRAAWDDHFKWEGPELVGKSSAGRATIRVLAINRPDAVAVRSLLLQEGVYPAD